MNQTTNSISPIRSFIAIELPPEVKKALTRLQDRFKPGDAGQVKWVDPENIHLTLHFLGNIQPDAVKPLTAAVEQAAAGSRHFQLDIGELGAFPDLKRVQTIWVGLAGDLNKLDKLYKDVGANMVPLGFKPETRPFSPHLTIGRVRDFVRPEERAALSRMIENSPFNAKYRIDVIAVDLMKSQLTPRGPIYTKLASVKLK
jgi:RNA 2',3'-cyclic 3'-phosphodiesterase